MPAPGKTLPVVEITKQCPKCFHRAGWLHFDVDGLGRELPAGEARCPACRFHWTHERNPNPGPSNNWAARLIVPVAQASL